MSLPTAPVELVRKELGLPTYVDDFVLTGAVTVSVPAGAQWVKFAPADGTIYLRVGGDAAAPGADITTGAGSYPLRKEDPWLLFNCKGVTSFSLFGNDTIGLAWYRDHTSPIT